MMVRGFMTIQQDTSITCPSCHTARPGVTNDTWDAGGQWRCGRCGERWTRTRLATVAEYAAWERAYDATGIMKRGGIVAVALLGLALSASASAQDVSRYRDYALESSLETVIVATRTRGDDVRILHERPARIQELQFRAPYQSDAAVADPMRSILFSFVDGQLYQFVVTYDRDRTEGLSDADIVGSLSNAYGAPSRGVTPVRVDGPSGTFAAMTAVAKWETDASRLILVRDKYVRDFQLVFTSRSLESRAAVAAREAVRLDAIEAPRREIEQRRKATADADAVREKTRSANKATFRP